MNKKQQIKVKPKKVKADSDAWLTIVKNIVNSRRQEFSFLKRTIGAILKKKQKDPERESCKELIQRLDSKKLSIEEAQQMALASAESLQKLKGNLPSVLIYLLGGGLMLLFSIIFLIIRSPRSLDWHLWISNHDVLFWFPLLFLNSFIFYLGLQKRKAFENELIVNAILSQSCAAYAAARAPGKGGSLFEAYRYLDLIREKNKNSFNEKFNFAKGKK